MISTIVKIKNMRSSKTRLSGLCRRLSGLAANVAHLFRGEALEFRHLPFRRARRRRTSKASGLPDKNSGRKKRERPELHAGAGGCRGAEAIERARKIRGNGGRVAPFDVRPLQHEGDFPVAHQRDRRRRRSVAGEITSSAS